MLCQKLKVLENQRTIALIVLLIITFSATTGFALALFFKPAQKPLEPLGYLTAVVKVNNVSDVYGWQVGLRFDPQKMSVVGFKPGDFLGSPLQDNLLSGNVKDLGSTLFFSHVYPDGTLVLCQTLKGEYSPRSGSGTLAVIEFQYYSLDFEEPSLIFNDQARGTMLGRKDASEIPISYDQIIIEFEFLS